MSEPKPAPEPIPIRAEQMPIPRAYTNGIGLGYSKTEVVITCLFGSEAQVNVVLPFPVARALSEGLRQIIVDFEARSSQKVLLPDEIIPDSKLPGSSPAQK